MTGRKTYALLSAFAVLVIAGAIGVLLFGTGQKAPAADRRAEAVAQCESAVKDQLKAPATAKFSGVKDDPDANDVSSRTYRQYSLVGSVDAENSFGALIRSSWSCTAAYNSDSGEWAIAHVDVSSSQG